MGIIILNKLRILAKFCRWKSYYLLGLIWVASGLMGFLGTFVYENLVEKFSIIHAGLVGAVIHAAFLLGKIGAQFVIGSPYILFFIYTKKERTFNNDNNTQFFYLWKCINFFIVFLFFKSKF